MAEKFIPEDITEKGVSHEAFVQGVEETSFEADKNPESPDGYLAQLLEDARKLKEEVQELVDSHRGLFATYAKDVSLRFRASDRFAINYESGEVHIAAQWFREQGYTDDQIVWAIHHELTHFRDLVEDPECVMGNFEDIRRKARKTGDKILEKYKAVFEQERPQEIADMAREKIVDKKKPHIKMRPVDKAAYQIYHTFYNICDDIHVNASIAYGRPYYRRGQGFQAAQALYREKLFAESDFSRLPRHLQILYKLIRESMVPDEETVVCAEVAEAMTRKILFEGKEYTVREIVDTFLKPSKNVDTLPGRRYQVIQSTLEPIFDELLEKDLADWDPKEQEKQRSGGGQQGGEGEGSDQGDSGAGDGSSSKPSKDNKGDGGKPNNEGSDESGGQGGDTGNEDDGKFNPFGDDYKDYQKKTPDQFDDSTIEDFAEHEKNKPTPEEQFCIDNNIPFEQYESYTDRLEEVRSHLKKLEELWRRIVRGEASGISWGKRGHYKRGGSLDITQTRKEMSKIMTGRYHEARTRLRNKPETVEMKVDRPEYIYVYLVLDYSGSMATDVDKTRTRDNAQVLLLESLHRFNQFLQLQPKDRGGNLRTDTGVIAYGNRARWIKKPQGRKQVERNRPFAFRKERVDIIKSVSLGNEGMGGTWDVGALDLVSESLSKDDLQQIQEGSTMVIVIEVTDGGTSSQYQSRDKVTSFEKAGIIARAFMVGETEPYEKDIFNAVWNHGRPKQLGKDIGSDLERLAPELTDLLEEYLGDIEL